MADLGSRNSPAAVVDNQDRNPYGNGFWSVEFDPATFGVAANGFEIYHMTLSGPAGSSFQVFINHTFYSTSPRGDLNEWDPNQPLFMIGGQSLFFYWNSAATPAPKVTVWMRTPRG